jgi:hypothetical protein
MASIPAEAPKPDKKLFDEINLSNSNDQVFQNTEISTESISEEVDDEKNKGELEKPEGFYISKKFIKIGGAVLAAAIVALSAGIAILNNKRAEAIPTPTTIDDSYTPSTETENSQITISSTESTQAIETKDTNDAAMESIAKDLEKYESMDYKSFELLTLDERLPYSQYLIDQSSANGEYDSLYGVGERGYENRVEYTTVSKENTGQEIIDNNLYVLQSSLAQSSEDNFDLDQGIKILSSAFYVVGELPNDSISNLYLYYKNTVELTLKNADVLKAAYVVTGTSELRTGKDDNGNDIEYKIIKYRETSQERYSYARVIYYEFSNYDGSKSAVWLFDRQEPSLEELGESAF